MGEVTLYLHIGATKTGTTALQRFLEQNFSKLKNEFSILYPNFHDAQFYDVMRDGYNYWHGHYFESTDGSKDVELFGNCILYCKQHSLRSIVVSHEALLVNWHERMGKLAGKLDANIKVICYVRRQDHHLESAWKQWGHKFVSSSQIIDSLERYNEQWGGWRQTDWYRLLKPWALNFGMENIIVRPYEREQMPEGVLPDFLRTINVSWDGTPTLRNDVNVNSGFSRDVLEFLSLNRDFYENQSDQRLHNMMNRVLDESYKKKPFESYGILSPKERLEILKKYELSNQRVAKDYLKREDGRLFFEVLPNPEDAWEPYEGLTVERLVPIITKIMYKLYAQQNALATQRNRVDLHSNRLPDFLKKAYRKMTGQ